MLLTELNEPENNTPSRDPSVRPDTQEGRDTRVMRDQHPASEATSNPALLRQLQVLQAVSDVALEHAQLGDLLQALLRRIQVMLSVDNVAILLPTPDGAALTLYRVYGPEEAVLGQVRVPLGEGVAGTIAATRQPLIAENLATVPVSNPFLLEHFRSLLGVPLLADERLVGVLHIDTVQPRQFTDDDLQLAQALAERITIAIVRAQQYEGEQQRRQDAERQVAVLQATTERMDEFLSIASHELRTPITNLAMNGQLLDLWLRQQGRRRADEAEGDYLIRAVAAVQPLIERSNRNFQRLNRLVGDLLDAARLREQRLVLRTQQIDLARLVEEIVEEYQQSYPTRAIHLTRATPTPLLVDGDPDRIGQVLSNYLNNALKFAPPDRPVSVALQREGEQARVAVHDEGDGIPEGEVDHIWERFYRGEGITPESGSLVGLGLGLYISRAIIERHGGQVGVASVQGHGSTFWFTLPLASATRTE